MTWLDLPFLGRQSLLSKCCGSGDWCMFFQGFQGKTSGISLIDVPLNVAFFQSWLGISRILKCILGIQTFQWNMSWCAFLLFNMPEMRWSPCLHIHSFLSSGRYSSRGVEYRHPNCFDYFKETLKLWVCFLVFYPHIHLFFSEHMSPCPDQLYFRNLPFPEFHIPFFSALSCWKQYIYNRQ